MFSGPRVVHSPIFDPGSKSLIFDIFFENPNKFSEFCAIFESRVGEISHFLSKMKNERGGGKEKHCFSFSTTNVGSKSCILSILVSFF